MSRRPPRSAVIPAATTWTAGFGTHRTVAAARSRPGLAGVRDDAPGNSAWGAKT